MGGESGSELLLEEISRPECLSDKASQLKTIRIRKPKDSRHRFHWKLFLLREQWSPSESLQGNTCRINRNFISVLPTTALTGSSSEKEEVFSSNQDVHPATTLERLVF
jgi:hypothetical protein